MIFLTALVHTVANWVYSKSRGEKILKEKEEESGDKLYASSVLNDAAKSKFRPGYPQGQFGELLLFNFLQHFFHAVPILRKQRITTNIELERNGADAIHYNTSDGKHIFYLGESKCYESKYQFKAAFEKSLKSIKKTFDEIDSELDLYINDDFIEDELQDIVRDYKAGKLKNIRYELVCIIIYNEHHKLTINDEKQIKEEILEVVNSRCNKVTDDFFTDYDTIIDRLHYIIFPVWALDELLQKFQQKVGSEKPSD